MSEGFDVVVLDDLSSGRRENLSVYFGKPNFCLVEGDVNVKADVQKALEGVDVVFSDTIIGLLREVYSRPGHIFFFCFEEVFFGVFW